MMEEYNDDLPDNVVPPAMKISGNKRVTNYAELVQELTEQDWQEIYWLEEHVANVSYESWRNGAAGPGSCIPSLFFF